ncbi:hypothetical protein MJO52_03175 [Microbulbifer variabilis]|uniref:DUF3168 domain-containing protein n=1 Tax=Microbulbifer variabilis TaxID=266805 RepID=A0ABY4VDE3_9GAMM|nr:hypothetical protein [Microbulbifer variabilis]USD22152.1 hypothetical protein MJO52_03175 [Microbulbifer variabilis]
MTQRITIRDAVLNKLQTLSGYTFPPPGTTEEIDSRKLPAIVVGFATENIEHEMYGGSDRQLDLTVAAVVKSRGDVYAALDQAAEDIELALQESALDKTCDLFLLIQTQFALDEDHPLGEVRLTYRAQYSTEPSAL